MLDIIVPPKTPNITSITYVIRTNIKQLINKYIKYK